MYLSGKLIRYNQHKQQLGDSNKGHVEAIPSQCTDSLIKTNTCFIIYKGMYQPGRSLCRSFHSFCIVFAQSFVACSHIGGAKLVHSCVKRSRVQGHTFPGEVFA
jgi:hypothetical protein